MRALRSLLAVLLVAALVASFSCTPVAPAAGLRCSDDRECARDTICQAGRCVDGFRPPERDAGKAPNDAGGNTPNDAGQHDAGQHDAGNIDPGRTDSGVLDAGQTDSGAPPDDDAGQTGVDASTPDDSGTPPPPDAGIDGGDTCGCPTSPSERAPIEVCGDGWDNDCDGAADETPCGGMRRILVTPAGAEPLPAGYSVSVRVSAELFGKTEADQEATGEDVRVWFHDGVGFAELHRVLDPDEDWVAPSTLWFALTQPTGSLIAPDYRLTWGALPDGDPTPPLDDEDEVFHFADYFEDDEAAGLSGWSIQEDVGDEHDFNIRDGALILDSVAGDENGFPYATRDFEPLTGGFLVDLGFYWSGSDEDEDYAWRFVVGDATMPAPATNQGVNSDGVGPNLIWGYGDGEFGLNAEQSLAVDEQADDEPAVLATGVQTKTRVQLVGDTALTGLRVFVNGAEHGGLSFLDTISSLSRMRFYPSEMAHTNGDPQFPNRRFEHVIVRARVSAEPVLDLEDVPPCE